jgi:hypothetical protein
LTFEESVPELGFIARQRDPHDVWLSRDKVRDVAIEIDLGQVVRRVGARRGEEIGSGLAKRWAMPTNLQLAQPQRQAAGILRDDVHVEAVRGEEPQELLSPDEPALLSTAPDDDDRMLVAYGFVENGAQVTRLRLNVT